jgi:hypothetical protein
MIHNTQTLIAIAAAQGKKKARQQERRLQTGSRQEEALCAVMYDQGTIAVVMRREVHTQ